MTLILDSGALVAYERRSRQVVTLLEWARRANIEVKTTTGVVAQVWRNGARQARLAILLRGVLELELTREQARRIGVLLTTCKVNDVIDGSVIDIARDGDEIFTSDPHDLTALAESAGKTLLITQVS